MGIGYIDFVADQGGKHSEEIAKEFSLKQAEKIRKFIIAEATKIISAIHTVMGISLIQQR